MACDAPRPHTDCDPDLCTVAKIRYWRETGGLAVSYQGGPKFWHNKTVKSEVEKAYAEAKARGNEIAPYKSVFGNR